MLAWAEMLELDKEMAKETMEATIKTINCKRKKMITAVMVTPLEAMKNKHLLMRRSTVARKNNNNNMGHYIRRGKLAKRLT